MKEKQLNLSRSKLQVDELDLLIESVDYGDAVTVTTPKLLQRLRTCVDRGCEPRGILKVISVDINLAFLDFTWADALLKLSLPGGYPEFDTLTLTLSSEKLSEQCLNYCMGELQQYLRPFEGHPCIATAIEFLVDNVEDLLRAGNDTPDVPTQPIQNDSIFTPVNFIRFNHLLKGPEHKKEKSMVDIAKKKNLNGAIIWGTPGIVCLLDCDDDEVMDYMRECKTIGKRPDGPTVIHMEEGKESRVEFGKGKLAELSIDDLRLFFDGNEVLFREALGIC